mmetsp:Transcript_21095/g.38154  ORF Transcript_21095/g.38154 Transcript_21095/m.38154 type:complete len:228 (+) Transcript_21095:159-842(+)
MTIHTSKSMGAIIAPQQSKSTASLTSMAAGGECGSIKVAAAINNSTFSHPTPRRSSQRPVRDGRQRPPTRKAKNIQREYQILQSQTLLLLGTAITSFLLFLLFTLPFAALIGLTVMVSSIGACILVASAAVKTRYQLELEHPLGLIRYLPESLRAHLTEKSLHDCLSPSGSTGSLPSLSHYNHSSKDSLSSLSQHNSLSKGSLSSLTQHQPLEQGNRQRHPRGVRAD